MKQVLIQKGKAILEEVPSPTVSENEVLVKTHYSVISTGTELAELSASKESLISRAFKYPHHVKKALKMASEKGALATYNVIKGMLDFGKASGYSLAGEVVAVGANVADLKKGDLVACGGAGIANHAEYVAVPRLLVSRVPAGLDLKQAASVTLGAIALQGVRQAEVQLGDKVAVIGLGLIGQLTCQLLRAAGCHVVGIDPDTSRCDLAVSLGTHAALTKVDTEQIQKLTDGFGVDATIITASTQSHEPINQAMAITRKKGRVVVVGAVGLNLERSPWYEKEITVKISCSYGPGRYDETYEQEMLDYPFAYVRWTENRNMEEYLNQLRAGGVDFLRLSPREMPLHEAARAYELLSVEKPLAVILIYAEGTDAKAAHTGEKRVHIKQTPVNASGKIRIALVGAGAFATTTHLPNIMRTKDLFHLTAIVSKKGTTAKQYASKYHADYCATDAHEVLRDQNVDAVLIATRHHLHGRLALESLKAGKAVFVEKPLAITHEELDELKTFFDKEKSPPLLMVGFNRRFSPYAVRIKELTANRKNPLMVQYRVNAGFLPKDHWVHGKEGGGRILGEACHFFDLFQFWTGASPVKVETAAITPQTKDTLSSDNFSATVTYSDGSVCTLLYTALGNKDLPKEYAEIYCDGSVFILDDYRRLTVKGRGTGLRSFRQDKGHGKELAAFAQGLRTGTPPIPPKSLFETTELCFEVARRVTN